MVLELALNAGVQKTAIHSHLSFEATGRQHRPGNWVKETSTTTANLLKVWLQVLVLEQPLVQLQGLVQSQDPTWLELQLVRVQRVQVPVPSRCYWSSHWSSSCR